MEDQVLKHRIAVIKAKNAEDAAKAARSSAFNATAALTRLRQENAYLDDRCKRLEAFVTELAARLTALETHLAGRE